MTNGSTWRKPTVLGTLVAALSLAGLTAAAAAGADAPVQTNFSALEGTLEPGTDVEISFTIDPTGFETVTWQVGPEGVCPPDFSVHENPGTEPIVVQCTFDPILFVAPFDPPFDIYIEGYDPDYANTGETTVLLSQTINVTVAGREGMNFSDTVGTTHANAIHAIAAAGITGGFSDGTFRPNETVSRGQMATFLTNALSLESSTETRFTDAAGTTHAAAIEAIAAAGITGGFSDGTFRPNETVSRGQMATFLANALELQ